MEIRGGSFAIEDAFDTPGLACYLYSLPFEGAERGGDVHYVSLCGGGVITRVVVADVSGHGASVAEFAETLRELMRKNINHKSQTRLVQALNRQFGEHAQLLRFATAVVATYLATKRSLTVCNAGHPRPLCYRKSQDRWSFLDRRADEPGNLPLGLDDESPYHQFTETLEPGDLICFYTDALTEAKDSSGKMLGEEGLLELVRGLQPASPRQVAERLIAGIDATRQGRPAEDDVTLLCLYHNGKGPRPPALSEKLDVYAKVFGLRGY
ncbi:MAG: PP2C family protein-serine/threonine phosphatase [Isosphaeraceae bacterium]